jgi:hypothetical protein
VIKKGQTVKVKPFQRLRTIYNNAEVAPGKWKKKAGYTGIVDEIYDDTGEDTYIVKRWMPKHDAYSYEEHTADELE